ncbi:MAG: hypothetical protein U1E76_19455 [Planctomycetota bacterium]
MVVSEGLTIYLEEDAAAALARDLAAVPSFAHRILDSSSPGLLRMLKKKMGRHLDAAGAPLKFAPAQGADYPRARLAAGRGPLAAQDRGPAEAPAVLPAADRALPRAQRPTGTASVGGVYLLAHG